MSDDPQAEQAPESTTPESPEVPELPEEWKPEPREWTWKDVFTAPMLAFKPKCMLISLLTVIALAVFGWGWWKLVDAVDMPVVGPLVCWIGLFLGAVIFGIGTTLVSVFFKADLLDDEFLSLGEAIKAFGQRFKAAILVPLFLVGVIAGFDLAIWGAELVGSIPYIGPLLYAVLHPLGWLLALLRVLLAIGVVLALFVGPAVLAVRKHGWFDNVIDVFEAVGTKPHQLVGNLILTTIMICICYGVPQYATYHLAATTWGGNLWSNDLAKIELSAQEAKAKVLPMPDCSTIAIAYGVNELGDQGAAAYLRAETASEITALQQQRQDLVAKTVEDPSLDYSDELKGIREEIDWLETTGGRTGYHYTMGWILAFWQTLVAAFIVGYCLNVFLAGGMLTYLAVREDDYWDDEDLEDLDKLAKELEEEARREAEAAEKPAAPASADTVQTEDKPAEDKPTEEEVDKSEDKPAEEDTDKAEDKPVEEADTSEDKPAEEEADTSEDKPAEEEADKAEDKPVDEEADKAEDKPAEEEADKPEDDDKKSD